MMEKFLRIPNNARTDLLETKHGQTNLTYPLKYRLFRKNTNAQDRSYWTEWIHCITDCKKSG